MLKKLLGLVLVFVVFGFSRQYIWKYWPTNYSDVRTDYERYARMWHYGLIPYTHHQYEYPPVTIPLLSLPLKYEHLGVNYYHNYRFEVLMVDIIFFFFFFLSVFKLFQSEKWWKKYLALGFYLLITTVAKDFFYEGLDLMFMASVFTSILLVFWLDTKKLLAKILIWFFFWLSTGIKFLTLPLLAPLFLFTYSHWKKDFLAFVVGFILVWGLPIAIYGKTLAVPFRINFDRPMKYSSFPSYLVQMADNFTNTESRGQQPPDFALYGPVSDLVTTVDGVLFPLSLAIWLWWSLVTILKLKNRSLKLTNIPTIGWHELKSPHQIDKKIGWPKLLRIYGLYLFTLFFFAKIFSQPFHIWYMALVAIYPWLAGRKPWLLWLATLLVVIQDTTTLFYLPPGITLGLHNYLWGFSLKFLLMATVYLFFLLENKPSKKR